MHICVCPTLVHHSWVICLAFWQSYKPAESMGTVCGLCPCCSRPSSVLSFSFLGRWLEHTEHVSATLTTLHLRWDLGICAFPGQSCQECCDDGPVHRLTPKQSFGSTLPSQSRVVSLLDKSPFPSPPLLFLLSLCPFHFLYVINRSKYTQKVYL